MPDSERRKAASANAAAVFSIMSGGICILHPFLLPAPYVDEKARSDRRDEEKHHEDGCDGKRERLGVAGFRVSRGIRLARHL